eukprot:1478877-Prymnesium_polylepis.1
MKPATQHYTLSPACPVRGTTVGRRSRQRWCYCAAMERGGCDQPRDDVAALRWCVGAARVVCLRFASVRALSA